MQVIHTVDQMRSVRCGLRRVAFVPTMGALHAGHESLIRRAHELAEHVVVSIFVNPTQFAPHEDFEAYPRPIERDLEVCERLSVDAVFNPAVEQMYPPGEPEVMIEVPALARMLEGASRPHFFGGVCRVCAKLFNMVQPDVACFGMKDYQQWRIVEAMVGALAMDMRIEPCPTIREPDGLAMSSRNVYLDAHQRERALGLSRALRAARAMVEGGSAAVAAAELEGAMRRIMEDAGVAVDYAVVRGDRDLGELTTVGAGGAGAVALVAGRVDQVRLIDNLRLTGGIGGG